MSGWIKHDGTGAPPNLPDGIDVEVKYRDGQTGPLAVVRYEHGDSAQFDDWSWNGSDYDVVAYRYR